MGSLKALQEWCRIQCEGYRDVDVKNMTSSFRDGLAFCAIIHKHRPDLIDFDSLSKDSVYENNRLAFEVAEAELGIPALLDAEDMVSMKVPDRLSVITYVSQYYSYFSSKNHAAPPTMKRPSGTAHSEPAMKKPVTGGDDRVGEPKSGEDGQSKRSTMSSTCAACGRHVHLVQRYLADGRLYHRNCFRCQECSSTLLPGSYRPGSEEGSLVCTHHFGKPSANQNGRPDLSMGARLGGGASSESVGGGAQVAPPPTQEKSQTETLPVGTPGETGSLETVEKREKEREGGEETEKGEEKKEEKAQPPVPPNPFEESEGEEGLEENRETEARANDSTLPTTPPASSTTGQSGGPGRPVPAPRRVFDIDTSPSPAPPPRPTPRSRTPRPADSPLVNGDPVDSRSSTPMPTPTHRSQSHGNTSLTNETRPKDPPWMALVQSEPRKKPPPPPPPGTPPRSGSVPALRGEEPQPTTPPHPSNPFEDGEEEEEAGPQHEGEAGPEGLVPPTVVASHPWYSITSPASGSSTPSPGHTDSTCRHKRPAPRAPRPSPSAPRPSSFSPPPSPALSAESVSSDSSSSRGPAASPGSPVTKSVSEPSISIPANQKPELTARSPSPHAPAPSGPPTNTSSAPATPQTNRSTTTGGVRITRPPPPRPPSTPSPLAKPGTPPSQPLPTLNKKTCKENPFNRKSSPTATPPKTTPPRGPRPARPPAPGHGFPLIKRKVQSDEYIPVEDIYVEMGQIERQLDELERGGVELEQKLRGCQSDEEEEKLLVGWFKLIHEKQLLVRREAELVYTAKQQSLEERQADVEYELRCLLNKPEKEWSEEDRAREQQLMQELVTIIEQRNNIVTSLDEDRQREEEEDKLLEAMIKKKEFQKEADSEPKKKHKFKPSKVLKILGKTESKRGSPRTSPSPKK
ncbi:MICAL-like protein 1 [Amia ocellicauda]|uniref:MICAL-like protein 1 n=1 Tax=Amia ocellicauda TaxID=2972642 RepID=UPI003463A295